MALTYSQFVYGFEVFDSGTSQNNRLGFVQNAVVFDDVANPAATLTAGVYTAKELAIAVRDAMRARAGGTSNDCTFDFGTLLFTLTGTGTFSLLFGHATLKLVDCSGLLGFTETDKTGSISYASNAAVGTSPSTAGLWMMAEPNSRTTPVAAQLDGTAAKRLQREVSAVQSRSDGGTVETIYRSTVKRVVIGFKALTTTEQDKMESFLDWIEQGRRFNWQPDKTLPNALRLVLANPKEISNDFTWLTRDEADYGELAFLEQLTRT